MPEREHYHSWDLEGLNEAFKTSPETTRDIAFGQGVRFSVGDGEAKSVEVYPAFGVARVTTSNARIEVHRVAAPLVSSEGVLFESQSEGETLRLSVTLEGEIILFVPAPGRQEAPAEQATPQEAGAEPARAAEEPKEKGKASERERLTLSGRVGATPAYRTTPKGTLVARFPLAVHHEENKTSWHTILAFGERAKKLQENLKKGDLIEVIGYSHTRETKTREGKSKTVEEIYAVVVKSR